MEIRSHIQYTATDNDVLTVNVEGNIKGEEDHKYFKAELGDLNGPTHYLL